MKKFLLISSVLLISLVFTRAGDSQNPPDKATVIIAVGAAGEDEYGTDFRKSAQLWIDACKKGGANYVTIGLDPTNATTDLARLKQTLSAETKESANELWLVLLGHGTFDGKVAKVNLRGPDLSADDLSTWLQPFKRPLAVIDCTSASAPFLAKLSAPGRVVITATRSGYEENYARFGKYLSEAIADPSADLDKDGQTSLLEAYLMASRRVAEFYDSAGRLATEHALLDDNGDGLGTPADWFRGVHAVKRAKDGAALDGFRAGQFFLVRSEQERQIPPVARARRDELELAVAKLRDSKEKINEDDYYHQLEILLLELARLSVPHSSP